MTARGDATAGAVVVKLNTLDGAARAFARSYDAAGARVWAPLAEGTERPRSTRRSSGSGASTRTSG